MSGATLPDSRPSLAELRSENAATMGEHMRRCHVMEASATCKVCRHLHAVNIVLDIAKAAQVVAHEATFHDDERGDHFEVEPGDMHKLDEALAKVRP